MLFSPFDEEIDFERVMAEYFVLAFLTIGLIFFGLVFIRVRLLLIVVISIVLFLFIFCMD